MGDWEMPNLLKLPTKAKITKILLLIFLNEKNWNKKSGRLFY